MDELFIINILLIAVFIIFGAIILRNVSTSQSKADKLKKDAHNKARVILEQAHEEAASIIQLATGEARDFAKKFEQSHATVLKEFSSNMGSHAEGAMKTFEKALEKEIARQGEIIVARNEEAHTRAEASLAQYKKKREEAIDDEARRIVTRAAKDVLGKSISPHEHNDLIVRALEQAKKEGIFN